jgi:hypothetical protein
MPSSLDGTWLGLGAAGVLAAAAVLTRRGSGAKYVPKGPVKATNYRIRRESEEERAQAGRYHAGLVIILPSGIPRITGKVSLHEGALVPSLASTRVPLSAGSDDDLSVWRWADDYFVLSENSRMPYIGMQRITWDGSAWSEAGQVFLDSDHAIYESLGPKGLDYTDRTKVMRLEPYTAS